jgi:release factor glutamine methyltransferase
VDVITLHPPYVPSHELKDLPEEIRDWEPAHTLTDRSRDGLSLISRTAREAPAWLSRNGWLLLEVSTDRVKDVKPVLQRSGFREVRSTKGGTLPITRVIVAKRPA